MNSRYRRKLALACALLFGLFADSQSFADDDKERCTSAGNLRLVNGNIVTMDARNSVVSSVTIKNGRIATVGGRGDDASGHCTRVINLHGRTAIPGLIDNHNHIVLLGIRPGHDARIENAASIAEVQEAIRQRAGSVPANEFITAIGGWNSVQFAEKRLPLLAELDAAAPQHPVYVQQSFTGPSATSSAGKAFFETRGVAVSATGQIAANAPTLAALNALRAIQTFEDQKRGTLDATAYAAGLGITTHFDMGGFVIPGTPHTEGSFLFDGAASWNPYTAYDAFLQLQREGRLPVRLRVFFLSMDTQPENPLLTNRVLNAFREFGGDMMKIAGLGEFITTWPLFGPVVEPPNYAAAVRIAAERGWVYQQHTLSLAEDQFTTSAWERLNNEVPIADLHWSIAHALTIDPPTVSRLKAMGAGLALHGFRYLAGTPTSKGPPYRMIVDSGIRVGAGSDSAQISPLNSWLNIYYMVTGKNSSGVLINAGQTLTRLEALRLYTAANGWFSKEETLLGSIEVGKYGDIVVLNDNFLDPRRVSDEGIKRMRSVLTVVGGKVVHDEESDRGRPHR
jgi:predicted amidohydrolase YtcJ